MGLRCIKYPGYLHVFSNGLTCEKDDYWGFRSKKCSSENQARTAISAKNLSPCFWNPWQTTKWKCCLKYASVEALHTCKVEGHLLHSPEKRCRIRIRELTQHSPVTYRGWNKSEQSQYDGHNGPTIFSSFDNKRLPWRLNSKDDLTEDKPIEKSGLRKRVQRSQRSPFQFFKKHSKKKQTTANWNSSTWRWDFAYIKYERMNVWEAIYDTTGESATCSIFENFKTLFITFFARRL